MKKVLFFSLTVFLLLQFYQPARNADNGQVLPIHIAKVYNMPTKVQQTLQNSCYDCHSNNTHYPYINALI